jgi:broad specificity phosphatase PhoE
MPRRNLDELYAGTCDGMTYKEIEQVYPEEFERRQRDKLAYRYPRGELDLISLLSQLLPFHF